MRFVRGDVHWADAGFGRKRYLVVSDDRRNTHPRSAFVVRLTTTPKAPLDTIVELSSADTPFVGRVLCDDVETLEADGNVEHARALSPRTVPRVDDALRVALALWRPTAAGSSYPEKPAQRFGASRLNDAPSAVSLSVNRS